jgi:hypothetical protein
VETEHFSRRLSAKFEKAERMFMEAVAESGYVYRDGKIIGAGEDDDENSAHDGVDKSRKNSYNGTQKSGYKMMNTDDQIMELTAFMDRNRQATENEIIEEAVRISEMEE